MVLRSHCFISASLWVKKSFKNKMYLFIMMQQDFVSLQTEILILFYVSMLNLANLLFKEVYFLGS